MKKCNFLETFSAYQSQNNKLFTVRFYIKMKDDKDLKLAIQTGTLEMLDLYVQSLDFENIENIAFEYVDEIDVGRIGCICNCLEDIEDVDKKTC